MVQDPRVTKLLGRLGGLYNNPARVDRDASSLLRSSVGVHLTPGISDLVENNGDSFPCLVLQGTIAIVFRGMTYQLLVDIYLPPGYPIRPPLSYVRLAKNQYLKEKHPHVGRDGMVYLSYTHEWNLRTHSLIEMVVAMSSVFSADPPVFTRAAPVTPPPPTYSNYVSSSNAAIASKPNRVANNDRNTIASTSTDSERYMQEQIAAIVAKEAEEANRAIEITRRAEKEREEQITAQKEWEKKKLEQTRIEANKKLVSFLHNVTEGTKSGLYADWRDQNHLKQNKDLLENEMKDLTQKKCELKQHIEMMGAKTEEIENWLEESKIAKEEEPKVDDLCQPVSKLDAQMLDLSAESAALTDTMYFLDRGMYMGRIDCTSHLKMIRKLAKRQFLIRAHLIKINQVIAKS